MKGMERLFVDWYFQIRTVEKLIQLLKKTISHCSLIDKMILFWFDFIETDVINDDENLKIRNIR